MHFQDIWKLMIAHPMNNNHDKFKISEHPFMLIVAMWLIMKKTGFEFKLILRVVKEGVAFSAEKHLAVEDN